MSYEEALEFHVAEFDRQVKDLREIMMRPHYDNDESPEVLRLQTDIKKIVSRTFKLKQCFSEAESLAKKEAPGLFHP